MFIRRDLVKVILKNSSAICLMLILIFCFVLSIAAQPGDIDKLSPFERKRLTQNTQNRVDLLSGQIKKDDRNVVLYKERLRLYSFLLELNFDNSDWEIYADKYEADLSRIIELEKTGEKYGWRGGFLQQRLYRSPPPKKITELYPHNRYFDKAESDFTEAIRLTSDPEQLQTVYSVLSGLYTLRPQKLVSAPNFPEWRDKVRLKPVLDDFDAAIKSSKKALEFEPKSEGLQSNLVAIYMTNADTAVELGAFRVALEFYDAGQSYLNRFTPICRYYAAWGNTYLKLNKPDKAIEIFNAIPITSSDHCAELLGNKGEALTAKGDFQKALADYDKALTYDKSDSLMRRGWLYIKRAKLFLKLGQAEQALADLTSAAEKKYVVNCPQLYQVRAKAYRKLGRLKLAMSDRQTANNLKNQVNCLFE